MLKQTQAGLYLRALTGVIWQGSLVLNEMTACTNQFKHIDEKVTQVQTKTENTHTEERVVPDKKQL